MSTVASIPAASAWAACARPISSPSAVTAALSAMFCDLNGATRNPARASTRHNAAVSTVFPTPDPVLNLTVGLPHLYFLPAWNLGMLLIAGTLLGGLGGYLGRGAGR